MALAGVIGVGLFYLIVYFFIEAEGPYDPNEWHDDYD